MTSTPPADPFAVTTIDVRGVPTKVFAGAPSDLRAIWASSAAHGPNTYLVYGDERYTFADVHRSVAVLAARLAGTHGVRPGERVAVAMRNYPEWAVTAWATFGIGAVLVPLNAWWTGPELAYGLEHSGATVLVADDERLERLVPHLATTSVRTVITVRTDRTVSGSETWASALATDPSAPAPALPEVSIDPDDDATIMYTSGTTGRPKGAVATHRNFAAFLMNMLFRARPTEPAPADAPPPPPPATLLTFPLFHVGGLQSFLMPYAAFGGKIVLLHKWDAPLAAELIERERITAIAGVPTTVFQLLEVAAAEGRDLSSLGAISSGATLVPPELVRRIDDQLAHRTAPTNGYGLTETSGAAIANGGQEYLARPDSVGRPISPVMSVRIARPEDGGDVPAGDVGEIWLQGPTVVRGYYADPQATAASFVDGWFRTGDLGRLDDEGFLYVVDRLKDVVIRGGENVYAAEVEAAIYEHPDVMEAAIIGLPHDRLGEEVAAVVRRRPGSDLDPERLRAHVAARLAAFKVPSRVWVVDDELPRNATGKVLKRELREAYAPH